VGGEPVDGQSDAGDLAGAGRHSQRTAWAIYSAVPSQPREFLGKGLNSPIGQVIVRGGFALEAAPHSCLRVAAQARPSMARARASGSGGGGKVADWGAVKAWTM
jgi:hypothetical protein